MSSLTARLKTEQEQLLDAYLARRDASAFATNTTQTAQRSDLRYEVKYSLRNFVDRDGVVFGEETLQNGPVTELLACTT